MSHPNGNWLDEFGACRVCGGEIPLGHTDNCDLYKLEKQNRLLETQLAEANCAKDNLFKIKQAAVVENVSLKKQLAELSRRLTTVQNYA